MEFSGKLSGMSGNFVLVCCWEPWRTVQARIMKFYTLIEDNRPHKHAANDDVTSCFRSAVNEVRKTAENAASHGIVFALNCLRYTVMHCLQPYRI